MGDIIAREDDYLEPYKIGKSLRKQWLTDFDPLKTGSQQLFGLELPSSLVIQNAWFAGRSEPSLSQPNSQRIRSFTILFRIKSR
jgi:hypothetical protein